MSVEQLQAQKNAHWAEYEVWAAAREAEEEEKRTAKAAKKLAAQNKLKALGLTEEDLQLLGVKNA